MSSRTPWSVKGIDPKAREVAKDLARRSDMTLGTWLNARIFEEQAPQPSRADDDLPDLNQTLDQLGRRLDLAEAALQVPVPEALISSLQHLESKIEDLAARIARSEQGSARRVSALGREVLTLAEALTHRVSQAEARNSEAIGRVSQDLVRMNQGFESRLSLNSAAQADAMARLGGEIALMRDRLAARMADPERKPALGANLTPSSTSPSPDAPLDDPLRDRIRQSEGRTALLLEQARAQIEAHRAQKDRSGSGSTSDLMPPVADPSGDDLFDEQLFQPLPVPDARPILDTRPVFSPQARTVGPFGRSFSLSGAQGEMSLVPTGPVLVSSRDPAAEEGQDLEYPMEAPALAARSRPTNWTLRLVATTSLIALSLAGLGLLQQAPGGASLPRSGPPAKVVSKTLPPAVQPRLAVALTPAVTAPAATSALPDLSTRFDQARRDLAANRPGALADLQGLANLGFPPARALLIDVYDKGQGNIARDPAAARVWMQRGAEAGDRLAMHRLALTLAQGTAGPKDPVTASRWFRKAADLGLVDSQFNMGVIYERGLGVERDLTQAYNWYVIAARAGDGEARKSADRLREQVPLEARLAAGGSDSTATSPQDSADIKQAQRVLYRLGYYRGTTDGLASAAFKQALSAYQREHNLTVTGGLDPLTTQRLAVLAQ